jgi:hypothetical protein
MSEENKKCTIKDPTFKVTILEYTVKKNALNFVYRFDYDGEFNNYGSLSLLVNNRITHIKNIKNHFEWLWGSKVVCDFTRIEEVDNGANRY